MLTSLTLAEFLAATDTSPNTTANIVAAGGMVATLITAVALLITSLRSNRDTRVKLAEVKKTTDVTHTIVNQMSTDKDRLINAYRQQLVGAGIEPVIDQSLPVPGQPDPQPGEPTVEAPAEGSEAETPGRHL